MIKTAQRYSFSKQAPKGFTLIELLVVIAIIGVLAVVTFLVIDPIELNRKSRDTVRLADLQTLNQAITVAVQEATQSGSEILCSGGIATPCTGTSNPATAANRSVNGTGWVKVTLSNQRAVSLPALPIDPVNTGSNVYTYATNATADSWEIDGVLESKEYTVKQQKMAQDGGDDDTVYEIGSKLDII